MTGVIANSIAGTVVEIRKGATVTFQTGLEQLTKADQTAILNQIKALAVQSADKKELQAE